MRVIVAGSRNFSDADRLFKYLDTYHSAKGITRIVCGMARGADDIGYQWAKSRKIPVDEFPAEWDKYGKSAGYKRNAQMAEHADALIAVWDGKSKGTYNMIQIAKERGLNITVLYY